MLSRYKSGYFASKARKAYFLYRKRLHTLQALVGRNQALLVGKPAQKLAGKTIEQASIENSFPVVFLVDDAVAEEKRLRRLEGTEYRAQGSYLLGRDIKRVVTDSKAHAYTLFCFMRESGLNDVEVYSRDQVEHNYFVKPRAPQSTL